MKKFAVFGNPIAQSLSPTIHQMFAKSCGEVISYEKIEAPMDGFENAVEALFADPLTVGCNVTVPFKEKAFALAEHADDAATMAKAANTLRRNRQGELCAHNTDGIGLVEDLQANSINLAGAKVLLLGAGGAARGVVHPLIKAKVGQLDILNRTFAKAQDIADESQCTLVNAVADHSLAQSYDVVINSTSASLTGDLPSVPKSVFKGCHVAYDMVYAKETGKTVFMDFAAESGATIQLEGLGMLVEQAAASFAIWTGKQPDTAGVIGFLRNQ